MFLLSLLATSFAATEAPPEASVASGEPIAAKWDLTEGTEHRWKVETRIAFPGHAWLVADRNEQVRVPHLSLQAVLDCTVAEAWNDRGRLACEISDAALMGKTFPGDHGRLQVVLDEVDAKLTGAPVGITMKDNGRITDIEVTPHRVSGFVNRRTRQTDQFLRMLVIRSIAPLDFKVPDAGFAVGESWMNDDTRIIDLPVYWGSMGDARLVHAAAPVDDARVLVRSEGRVTMRTGGLFLKGDIEGYSVFDHERGTLTEAYWHTDSDATPTAGPFGRPYRSVSRIHALAPDEVVDLPETKEVLPAES